VNICLDTQLNKWNIREHEYTSVVLYSQHFVGRHHFFSWHGRVTISSSSFLVT
jgi:hypothetical protein